MHFDRWVVNGIAASPVWTARERRFLYERFNLPAGNAWIEAGCFFQHPNLFNVKLGWDVYINNFGYFDNSDRITIGRNTRIGPHITILTTTHHKGFPFAAHGAKRSPVEIGADCWIGAGVTILPGVKIGDRVVVGAGALVIHDLPPNGTYVGIPAKRIGANP